MSAPLRLIQTEGNAVLSGVQMVVKAGLEFGVQTLVGSQLDGPDAYAALLKEYGPLLEDKGLRTLTLPDARQAIAALISAWLSGQKTLGLFEAMGVIDAAGVLLSTRVTPSDQPGGVLLCFGPSDSSQGEAAMALLRRAGWVVLEPSLQDEVMSFSSEGQALSLASGLPVALALPQALLHGAATVACQANHYPASSGETKVLERAIENVDALTAALSEARNSKLNTVVNPPGKDEAMPLALVTVGRSFGWARQAMAELGLVGRIPILRLGMLSPLDESLIHRHVGGCQHLLVLDPTHINVSDQVRLIARSKDTEGQEDEQEHKEQAQITLVPLGPEAGPAGVIRALRPWLESHPMLPAELVSSGLARFDESVRSEVITPIGLPPRGTHPPPGSSLVDLSVVLGRLRRDLLDAQRMLEQHRSGPVELSVFGERDDTSALLMSRWHPLTGGMNCDGRLAGAAATGAASDASHRMVVLMTSRRFFSLGASAIADAVREGRDAVFIIHTEDPTEALGPRKRWRRRQKVNTLDMQAVVEGINIGRRNPTPSVSTIDPSDRPRMRRLLERLVLSAGVHVVIARRRRGPHYYRKASEVHQKQSARRGYVARQGCLVHCPEAGPLSPRRRLELGVLGVEPIEPGPDPWTVSVSWSWHDDTVMHALAEPSVGLAVLERSQPERSRVVAEDLDNLPTPVKPLHADADAWRATLVGVTGSALDLTLELLMEAGAAMGYLVRSTSSAYMPDEPVARRADVLFTRRHPANAPYVPASPGRASPPMLGASPMPGNADLLLGTELTESIRLIESDAPPAIIGQNHSLIDTLLIPDTAELSTGNLPDRRALRDVLRTQAQAGDDQRLALLPIAHLSEWLWGHQRYAAWVYMGYLVQCGWVPLTTTAIDIAGQRIMGLADARSAEAIKVGRKLAIDPGYASRMLKDEVPTLEDYLKTLAQDLSEQAGSRGPALERVFISSVQELMEKARVLDDPTRRLIVTTAQHCVYWAGPRNGMSYCEQFLKTLSHVIQIDNGEHGYALSRAAVEGLSRAMLIPDEVYLAALLTSPARYRRDRRRMNVSIEQGDRISYVHLLRPEFDLFKRRIAFTIDLGERALKTLASLHLLRRIRPGWYRTQRAFRDLYLQTLSDLDPPQSEAAYRHVRDIIACTAGIVGRGDVRRETVTTARRRLEKLISAGDEA